MIFKVLIFCLFILNNFFCSDNIYFQNMPKKTESLNAVPLLERRKIAISCGFKLPEVCSENPVQKNISDLMACGAKDKDEVFNFITKSFSKKIELNDKV